MAADQSLHGRPRWVRARGVASMGPLSAHAGPDARSAAAARSATPRHHRAWGKLGIARLRLDLVRLATRLVGRERADELVQRAFRAAVRLGPKMPRDRANIPSATHMGVLVRRLAGAMRKDQAAKPTVMPRRGRRSDACARAGDAPTGTRPARFPVQAARRAPESPAKSR